MKSELVGMQWKTYIFILNYSIRCGSTNSSIKRVSSMCLKVRGEEYLQSSVRMRDQYTWVNQNCAGTCI